MRIINVIEIHGGILNSIESFAIWEDQLTDDVVEAAEEDFKKKVRKIEGLYKISDEDLEIAIENGLYDNNNCSEVLLVWSDVN